MRLNYDRISPITNKMTVLDEWDEQNDVVMSLDMGSGYQTYDVWIEGSSELKRYEETSPDIITDSRFVEPISRQVWFKSTLFGRGFVLYPDAEKWKVGHFKPIEDVLDQRFSWAKMKEGEHEFALDDENADSFDNFEDALFKFHEYSSTFYDTEQN